MTCACSTVQMSSSPRPRQDGTVTVSAQCPKGLETSDGTEGVGVRKGRAQSPRTEERYAGAHFAME